MTDKPDDNRVVLSIGPIESLAALIREHNPPWAQEYSAIRRLLEIADRRASQPRIKRREATEEEEAIADAVVKAWANGRAAEAIVRDPSVPWIKTENLRLLIHSTLNELVNKRPDLFSDDEFYHENDDVREKKYLYKTNSAYRSHLKKAFDQGWRRDSYFPYGFDYPDRKPAASTVRRRPSRVIIGS